jgi:hypothetical protein
MAQTPKRPRDPNQLARAIVGIATGEKRDQVDQPLSAMAELGKKGGAKGGVARAAALTPAERSEIARKAADKRWAKD